MFCRARYQRNASPMKTSRQGTRNAARGRPRVAWPKAMHNAIAATALGPAMSHSRVRAIWRPPVGDTSYKKSARPPESTPAAIQSARSTGRCTNAEPMNIDIKIPVARIGSTNTTVASPSAAA